MIGLRSGGVIRRTVPVTGVTVITQRSAMSGGWRTTIHGGLFDGKSFTAWTPIAALLRHREAEELAKVPAKAAALVREVVQTFAPGRLF
jgi:hypothetical protein